MRSAMKTGIVLGDLLALAGCASYRPPTADVWGFQATSKQWGLTVLYTPALTQCQTARADVVRGGTADWTSFSECSPVRIVAGNGGFAFSIRTIVDQGRSRLTRMWAILVQVWHSAKRRPARWRGTTFAVPFVPLTPFPGLSPSPRACIGLVTE
jgi:hypothetical protein